MYSFRAISDTILCSHLSVATQDGFPLLCGVGKRFLCRIYFQNAYEVVMPLSDGLLQTCETSKC